MRTQVKWDRLARNKCRIVEQATGYMIANTETVAKSVAINEANAEFICTAVNAYDDLKAKADSHDGLVSALETAKGMLDHLGCVNNNCNSGMIETFHMGEPQHEQCQWCCETDSIKAALDAAKETK